MRCYRHIASDFSFQSHLLGRDDTSYLIILWIRPKWIRINDLTFSVKSKWNTDWRQQYWKRVKLEGSGRNIVTSLSIACVKAYGMSGWLELGYDELGYLVGLYCSKLQLVDGIEKAPADSLDCRQQAVSILYLCYFLHLKCPHCATRFLTQLSKAAKDFVSC